MRARARSPHRAPKKITLVSAATASARNSTRILGWNKLSFSKKKLCLHLFSGPSDRADGLSALLRAGGWASEDVDHINTGSGQAYPQDLSNEILWARLMNDVRAQVVAFVFFGIPCETWSLARTVYPGPRPLRSLEHPLGIPYGDLSQEEKEQLRLGTYFALKSIELANECVTRGIGFAIERPRAWRPGPSIFDLPEMIQLLGRPGVKVVDFDQCLFGADTTKPIKVVYFGCDLSHLAGSCFHPPLWWPPANDSTKSKWTFCPHVPIIGRQQPDGHWATKAFAAYPTDLNVALAKAILWGTQSLVPASNAASSNHHDVPTSSTQFEFPSVSRGSQE